MLSPAHATAAPAPAPRTQSSLTSIGAEPQSVLILFGGFALNIGCVNDLWRCTITLDLASMPVPNWTQLEHAGTPPSPQATSSWASWNLDPTP